MDQPAKKSAGQSRTRTRSELAHHVQEKLGEALHQLEKLSTEETDPRDNVDELEKTINRAVDARIAHVKQELSVKLDACATAIRNEVTAALMPGAHEQTPAARLRRFSEKVFYVRNSVLTNMLSIPDFQSIEHIFIAMLVWMGVNIMIQEWFEYQRFVDTTNFFYAFGKVDLLMPLWVSMCFYSFLIVPLVQAIVRNRWTVKQFSVIYVPYLALLLIVPSWLTVHWSLPPASGFIAMCEMARFAMKIHAYLREKLLYGYRLASTPAPSPSHRRSGSSSRSQSPAPRSGSETPLPKGPRVYQQYADYIPPYAAQAGVTIADLNQPDIDIRDAQTELGRFIYFLFAPTLIYRDTYPRSGNEIRWFQALTQFVNLLGVLAYTFLIFQTFCIPTFADTGRNPGDIKTFIISVMRSMVPGMGVFVMMFYGVLHSWFNMWAELLRFGDRRFYDDWWNARSFGSYYRRWNTVVHEWLYHYLYLDVIRFSLGRYSKVFATAAVFIVSAIVHEQIIACAMGFFYPVLLLMFGGPGVFFVNLTKKNTRFYNVFMWLMLSVGNALLMVLYSREWFARFGEHPVNYPGMNSGWLMLAPRSFLAFYQDFGKL